MKTVKDYWRGVFTGSNLSRTLAKLRKTISGGTVD